MTLLVLLLLGFGTVLVVSSFESGPDGKSVSVTQTIQDIWNDSLQFPAFTTNPPNPPGPGAPAFNRQSAPVGPGTGWTVTTLSAPASSQVMGGSALGSAAGPAPYLGSNQAAYRASVVRAYLQSQR